MSPPSNRPHVTQMAKAYADVLIADPVMAGQIKEHMTTLKLLQVLQLSEQEVIEAYRIPVVVKDDDGQ